LTVRDFAPTASVLTQVMGFQAAREYPLAGRHGQTVTVFATGPGGPGTEVHLAARPELASGRQGRGGVHHVAFRTPDGEQQREWQRRVALSGLGVTDIIDRFYFKSIYFREPGGILFEIATDGPGFASDEDPAHLGESLALPPFLEPYRQRIEAGLHPL
jgi:glyoxalase family protein